MTTDDQHNRQRHSSRPDEQTLANENEQEGERINQQEQRQAREFDDIGGTPGSALGPENDSAIDEASAESFPASDPPAWTRDG